MNLDVRFPIGLMFTLIGALLSAFGLFSDHRLYERSLDYNVNLWWGLVILLFGLVMLWFGWRAQKRLLRQPPEPQAKPAEGTALRRH